MEDMDAFLREVARIRNEARLHPFWKLNIEALIESNNEIFEGPISYEDMEACFNYVLDQYDPTVLIAEGHVRPEDLSPEALNGTRPQNPFFSLIELDDEGKVRDVVLWDTVDLEMVGEFLSRKYKWK